MIADIKKGAEQKMAKTVEALKVDLGKVVSEASLFSTK